MRKVYKIWLTVFATLGILLGLCYIQYPISADRASLEIEIQDFEEKKDIKVHNEKVIDNKIIAMYTFDGGMGYATFKKGINGRYILVSTNNSNGDTILIGYEYTNKDTYKIFAGRNYDNKINTIEITTTDSRRIITDVSKEEYYILATNDPKIEFLMENLDLYDAKGKSIKKEITSKYFTKPNGGYSKSKAELQLFNLWYVAVICVSGLCIHLIFRSARKKCSTPQISKERT